jgi:hypothetical protein
MSSKSKKPFRLMTIPLFLILVIWMAMVAAGCGSAAQGSNTVETFNATLKPLADQSAAALTTVAQTESSCYDDITKIFPAGLLNLQIVSLQSIGSDKSKELAACGPKLTQANATLGIAINGLKAVILPAGCDSCKNGLDTLNAAVNDAEKNVAQSIDLINFGSAILAARDDEMNKLMAIPNLGDNIITEHEMINMYRSQAAAYTAAIAKWKTFKEPEFADKIQAVIDAKQAQADIANKQADDQSMMQILEVQMAIGQEESDALQRSMNAESQLFQAIQDKLLGLKNSIDRDKASADRVAGNLTQNGATTKN